MIDGLLWSAGYIAGLIIFLAALMLFGKKWNE